MLNVQGSPQRTCSGWTRRQMLQAGGAGLLGLTLPKILAAEAVSAPRAARAKSVIFIFLFGGPSQLETFDLKPDAPSNLRGPLKPIASRTPEMRISELMPQLARISDKYCVVRTMTHKYNDHSSAAHYIQTGHPWHIPIGAGFNATEKDWPAHGSIVDYLDERRSSPDGQLPAEANEMPRFVYLPNRLGHIQTYSSKLDRPGQYAGWLGRGFDPLATRIDKKNDKDNPYFRACSDEELTFRIQGLALDEGLSLDRLSGRRSLVEQFDDARGALDRSGAEASYDQFRQRALALVSSEKVRNALDIRQESAATRDRYGRHLFGQSVLMARRLVEAGTRFVNVAWDAPDGYGWDSHAHSDDVKNHLIPGLDQGLSALLIDLNDRGMLDETLVVAVGEMGRTPKANGNWGRDHWSTLFPAVLAGAGVRGGMVFGTSDKDAAYALDHPTSPEDLAATVFNRLGIDHELRIADAQGRPVPLVDDGHVLHDVLT